MDVIQHVRHSGRIVPIFERYHFQRRDGWRSDQWEKQPEINDKARYIATNMDTACQILVQVEDLLDCPSWHSDSKDRIRQLARFFQKLGSVPSSRTIQHDGHGKFWNDPKSGTCATTLFDVGPSSDVIALTEGAFDAVSIFQNAGITAWGRTNGAKSFPEHLVPRLKGKTVYIVSDRDAKETGRHGAEKIAKMLDPWARVYIVEMPHNVKDISEFFGNGGTDQQFREMLKKAELRSEPETTGGTLKDLFERSDAALTVGKS